MIQDKGGNTPGYLADYTDRFIAAARQRPEIATISTTFQADEPQKAISIDNEKVLKAGHLARRAALADQLVSGRHVRQ